MTADGRLGDRWPWYFPVRFAAGQRDRECRAAFGIVAGTDVAPVSVDDVSGDREAYSEAMRFRGDERREQPVNEIQRTPDPLSRTQTSATARLTSL